MYTNDIALCAGPAKHEAVDGLSSIVKPRPESGVFDRIISADATELEIAQKRAASARSKLEQQQQQMAANRSGARRAATARSKV